ncbi:MAG TPA: hypothetical protein VIV10_10685 [Gemmatimonadales bacterium]
MTDVSTSRLAPNLLGSPCAYPASMVWVDPEEVESEAEDGERGRDSGIRQRGMRVFGPFETYEEGEHAATMLAADGDYRVIPVDPVATAELEP